MVIDSPTTTPGKVTNGADKIGPHGYAHWTGKPVTPGVHTAALVPQSLFDGWEAYCSCGEWSGFVSAWDFPTKNQTFRQLQKMHSDHVKGPDAGV